MKLEKDEYFADDCIIENDLYNSIKGMIKCDLCHKILKDPYMCNDCQKVYCKKCLENYSQLKICPYKYNEATFSPCLQKIALLSKIKYRCKNCKKEVIQTDIKTHLESNCEHKEKLEREKTLAEIIQTKKSLIKLSSEDMLFKKEDLAMTSKIIFYLLIIIFL